MASRGGRGGRGGGYKPPTGAQLFLQRSAQESGLDERNLKTLQDLAKPTLFPDHIWHSTEGQKRGAAVADAATSMMEAQQQQNMPIVQPKRTQSEIYKIRKAREFQHFMHTSPFYLRPSLEVDVTRHVAKRARPDGAISTSVMQPPCDKAVIEHLGRIATPRFVPPELLMALPKRVVAKGGGSGGGGGILDNDDMEVKAEGEEGEEGDDFAEPEEDEDEVEDYAKDYYASDEDGNGDDDGDAEPTF